MSNWIDIELDVLASSPNEINEIEAALKSPCEELSAWVTTQWDLPAVEVAADVKDLVAFRAIRNLGDIAPAVNKVRRFANQFKDRFWGVVWSHVNFVSGQFPDTVFLVSYWDTSMSYSGKIVVRQGQEVRQVHDGSQKSQGVDWVLPDIFAPYIAEHRQNAQFGLFWGHWLLEMEAALSLFRDRYGSPKVGATCESALLEWTEKFEKAAEFMAAGKVENVENDHANVDNDVTNLLAIERETATCEKCEHPACERGRNKSQDATAAFFLNDSHDDELLEQEKHERAALSIEGIFLPRPKEGC